MFDKILYVGNLDKKVNLALLYNIFEEHGKVKDIQVRTVRSRYHSSHHCIAFVTFEFNCDARRALKEIKMIDGKKAVIRWSRNQYPFQFQISRSHSPMSPPRIRRLKLNPTRVKIESWL
jgi:RNA recognition motif-containing protein